MNEDAPSRSDLAVEDQDRLREWHYQSWCRNHRLDPEDTATHVAYEDIDWTAYWEAHNDAQEDHRG